MAASLQFLPASLVEERSPDLNMLYSNRTYSANVRFRLTTCGLSGREQNQSLLGSNPWYVSSVSIR